MLSNILLLKQQCRISLIKRNMKSIFWLTSFPYLLVPRSALKGSQFDDVVSEDYKKGLVRKETVPFSHYGYLVYDSICSSWMGHAM